MMQYKKSTVKSFQSQFVSYAISKRTRTFHKTNQLSIFFKNIKNVLYIMFPFLSYMPLAFGMCQSDLVNNFLYIPFHVLLLVTLFPSRSSSEIFQDTFFLPALNSFG